MSWPPVNSKPAFDPSAEAIRQPEPNSDDSGSQNLSSETPNLPLPMYALLIIAGGILLLIVLAIIGQCFLAGENHWQDTDSKIKGKKN